MLGSCHDEKIPSDVDKSLARKRLKMNKLTYLTF